MRKQATCHPERPNHSLGMCKPCYMQSPAARATRERYRVSPAGKAAAAKYYTKPSVKSRQAAQKQTASARQGRAAYKLATKYGITTEAYEQLLVGQGGVCAICAQVADRCGRKLAVDHCHKSGDVRGLLCTRCNTVIGRMNDDPTLLVAAARYLASPRSNG